MSVYCPVCFFEIETENVSGEEYACPRCGENIKRQNWFHQLPTMTILRGRYLTGKAIGEGGFGITYVGYDLMLKAKIAIKEYYPVGLVQRGEKNSVAPANGQNQTLFSKGKSKFMEEAQILAEFIDDPNIVNVRDYFEENNTAYIVMEFLEGKSFKEILEEKGTLSIDEVLDHMLPLISSLQRVHEHNLIHRDISPANIMQLKDGRVKLLDFGAARDYSNVEKSMSIILKPGYAPEEQYNKRAPQGPWTDVYALCATIYKLITGVTPENSLNRIFKDELQRPSQMGIKISPAQENALIKGLALKSEDRFQSMQELKDAFENPFFGTEKKKRKLRKSALAGVGSAIIAAILALIFFLGKPEHLFEKNTADAKLLSAQEDVTTAPETVTSVVNNSPSQTPVPSPTPSPSPSPEPVKIVQSGEVGINGVVWELDSQGVLEIKGNGKMMDYNDSTRKAPWLQYADDIKKVCISEGITNISEYGFKGCTELKEVEFSNTVTMIGMRAFSDCTALESIVLPDSVVDVGGASFYNCTGLKEIDLGNSVRKIRGYAFFGCDSFDHITLPSSLLGIEDYAFYGCTKLESIFFNGYPNAWDRMPIGDGNYPIINNIVGTLIP